MNSRFVSFLNIVSLSCGLTILPVQSKSLPSVTPEIQIVAQSSFELSQAEKIQPEKPNQSSDNKQKEKSSFPLWLKILGGVIFVIIFAQIILFRRVSFNFGFGRVYFTITKNNVPQGGRNDLKNVYDKDGRLTSHVKQAIASSLFEQGTRKVRQNDLEGALADFNRVLQLNPNYSEAYLNRGITYRKLEKYREAIADFDQLIRLYPNVAEFYFARGGVYVLLGEYKNPHSAP